MWSSRRSRRATGLWGHGGGGGGGGGGSGGGGGLEPPSFSPASWREGGVPYQGSESPDTSGSESGEGGWAGEGMTRVRMKS